MFIIKLADLNIKINNRYHYIQHLCNNYIINTNNYQFEISISDNDLEYEKQFDEFKQPNEYLESIAVLRKISDEIIKYDGFVLHSSILKVDDMAYAFLARSGTGKTTHCKLWCEYLKDRVSFINGDKPIIRIIDNIPYAYGTPWNGKEGFGNNTKAPLRSICFLHRGKLNRIIMMNKSNVMSSLVTQIVIPEDEEKQDLLFKSIDSLIKYANFYYLDCNMEKDAAKVSFEMMHEHI